MLIWFIVIIQSPLFSHSTFIHLSIDVYCQHQLEPSHMYELPRFDAEASFVHGMGLEDFPNSKYAVEKTTLNVVFFIRKTVFNSLATHP